MYNYKNHTSIPKSELQKDVNYELCVHIYDYMSIIKETRIFALDFPINYNMHVDLVFNPITSYNSQVQLQNC